MACWSPWVVITTLNTVSTDDAYVNGHVTFVAPRVLGQVTKVLVDDNQRVKKGDLIVQLDKEPYQVQVNIKKATVVAAERDLVAAEAQARGQVAQTRLNHFKAPTRPSGTSRLPADPPTSALSWPLSTAERRLWSWRVPTSSGAKSWPLAGVSAKKNSTSAGKR